MGDIEKIVLNALQQLDSPCSAVTYPDVADRLRKAIGVKRLETFGSLPVSVQAETLL